MKVAVLQPYFCPYIGYFQLVGAVDTFVFYDDVNFIKRGWINRNTILSGNNEFQFTIPVVDASQFRLIKDTMVSWESKEIGKFLGSVRMSYGKAPFFKEVFPILNAILEGRPETISQLAIDSVVGFSQYLELTTEFKKSSEVEYAKTDDRVVNLSNITKAQGAQHYINPIGGVELYKKEDFLAQGVDLNFIKGSGSLSIIDVCMRNSKDEVKEMLKNYTLI